MRETRQALPVLVRLAAPAPHTEARARCAIVAAHPDDETASAASLLFRHEVIGVLVATDGAPSDPALRPSLARLPKRQAALVRRDELRGAMEVARIPWDRVQLANIPDQETVQVLPSLTRRIVDWIGRLRPSVIVGHAYEGGHPDHDAVAFAIQSALRLLPPQLRPIRIDMASYHRHEGSLLTGEFLDEGTPQVAAKLHPEELERKALMLRCYRSQAEVLSAFPLSPERFRLAPVYDFSRPPHPGTLHYESLGWMTGTQWRTMASLALEEIEWMGPR